MEMALAGHWATQVPQPRQISRWMAGLPSAPRLMAPTGQISRQLRQRRQCSPRKQGRIVAAENGLLIQNPGGRGRGSLGLGNRLRQIPGGMGQPTEKYAFRGRLHRSQFLVRLQKKTLWRALQSQKLRYLGTIRIRFNPGAQNQIISRKLYLPGTGVHPRRIPAKARGAGAVNRGGRSTEYREKPDSLFFSLEIIILLEAVGPNISIQYGHFRQRPSIL